MPYFHLFSVMWWVKTSSYHILGNHHPFTSDFSRYHPPGSIIWPRVSHVFDDERRHEICTRRMGKTWVEARSHQKPGSVDLWSLWVAGSKARERQTLLFALQTLMIPSRHVTVHPPNQKPSNFTQTTRACSFPSPANLAVWHFWQTKFRTFLRTTGCSSATHQMCSWWRSRWCCSET